MIRGNKRSKSMRRKSIKKPNFWIIFGIRFAVLLAVSLIAASYLLVQIRENTNWSRYNWVYSYLDKVKEGVASLYEAEPGTELYEQRLLKLKHILSIYQSSEKGYVEVIIGDMKLATDHDTAFYIARYELDGVEPEIYEIADMSYLEPVKTFMNGKFYEGGLDSRFLTVNDPVVEYMAAHQIFTDNDWICMYKTVYINRENHTFIPGVLAYQMFRDGKIYTLDCTPADTTGYELVDYGDDWTNSWISYRVAPELTSADVDCYYAPDPNVPGDYNIQLTPEEFEEAVKNNEYPWYVGFYDPEYREFYEAAPLSTVIILSLAVLIPLLLALVLAVIRYQKDKTVWLIFEYRTKTTEAMAHDLKTPLSSIMAYAESLESSYDDPSKALEYSKKINEKVSTMDHMIADILSLSRSGSGKIEVVSEEVSVMSIVNECLSAFPDLKAEIKGDDITLKTDKKLLKQAIENLFANCDRYGIKGSAINITTDPKSLLIINKTEKKYDDVESLKKPFVKGDDSRGSKGNGLGLSIAENNLNILGFKLELVSEEGLFKAIVKFK